MCAVISPALTILPMLVLTVLMPIMAVKGLRYRALMTTLNEVRFGFNCGSGQALWVMLGLPVLLGIAAVMVIMFTAKVMPDAETMTGLVVPIAILALLTLVVIGVVNGIVYGKWMQLLGNNATFGIHRFSVNISLKRSIVICIVSMLILIPFIFVIGSLMSSVVMTLMYTRAAGEWMSRRD